MQTTATQCSTTSGKRRHKQQEHTCRNWFPCHIQKTVQIAVRRCTGSYKCKKSSYCVLVLIWAGEPLATAQVMLLHIRDCKEGKRTLPLTILNLLGKMGLLTVAHVLTLKTGRQLLPRPISMHHTVHWIAPLQLCQLYLAITATGIKNNSWSIPLYTLLYENTT